MPRSRTPQSPEQLRASKQEGARRSMAGRVRYPKGHPRAGQLMPRGATPPGPTQPPAEPTPPPPAEPTPAAPPAGRLNPLTATPRDLLDRLRGR